MYRSGKDVWLSTVVTPAGASLTMYREIRSYANSIWDDNNNNVMCQKSNSPWSRGRKTPSIQKGKKRTTCGVTVDARRGRGGTGAPSGMFTSPAAVRSLLRCDTARRIRDIQQGRGHTRGSYLTARTAVESWP